MDTLRDALEKAYDHLLSVQRAKRRIKEVKRLYEVKLTSKENAYKQLEKENRDVEKITGLSIASFVATLLNNRQEKLEKEELEALEAKAFYDNLAFEVEEIEAEMMALKDLIDHEEAYKVVYEALLEKKRLQIYQAYPALEGQVKELDHQIQAHQDELKEINEAILAAKQASMASEAALKELKSAESLGVFDIMGGGLLVTLAKRSKMDAAQHLINRLNHQLKSFSRELSDVDQYTTSNIEISSYLQLGDWLFDGLFMDLFVQNKIKETITAVAKVDHDIERIHGKLSQMKSQRENEVDALRGQIETLIMNH